MTYTEAATLALDALEYSINTSANMFDVDVAELKSHRAITALRQLIEEPQSDYRTMYMKVRDELAALQQQVSSQTRKPLTRGQIREIEVDVSLNQSFDYVTPAEQLCRAIEQAHGIKENK